MCVCVSAHAQKHFYTFISGECYVVYCSVASLMHITAMKIMMSTPIEKSARFCTFLTMPA